MAKAEPLLFPLHSCVDGASLATPAPPYCSFCPAASGTFEPGGHEALPPLRPSLKACLAAPQPLFTLIGSDEQSGIWGFYTGPEDSCSIFRPIIWGFKPSTHACTVQLYTPASNKLAK